MHCALTQVAIFFGCRSFVRSSIINFFVIDSDEVDKGSFCIENRDLYPLLNEKISLRGAFRSEHTSAEVEDTHM